MSTNYRSLRRAATAVALSFVLFGCGGSEERQAEYIERARELLEAGNVEKAKLDLKNALQINANSAEARYLMALVKEQEEDWTAVYKNLYTALDIDPDHLPSLVKIGQFLVSVGRLEEARERLDRAMVLAPEDPEVLAAVAMLDVQQGEFETATERANAALAVQPGNALALTVLMRAQGEKAPELVLEKLRAGIAASPDELSLQFLEIRQLERMGRTDEVIARYREVIAAHPEEPSYAGGLANYLIGKFRADEAEALLRERIASQPDIDEFKIYLVRLLRTQEGSQAAIDELVGWRAADPANATLGQALAELYAIEGDVPAARKVYTEIVEADPEAAIAQSARVNLADLAFREGNVQDTQRWIDEALEIEPTNPDALLVNARLKLRAGDNDAAVGDLRMVLRSAPDSVPALLLLAEAQTKLRTVDLALDNYRRVVELESDNPFALYKGAQLLAGQQRYEEAAAYLERLLEDDSDNVEAINLLSDVYARQQRWDDAVELADRLAANEQTAGLAALMVANLKLRQGEFAAAVSEAEKVLADTPESSVATQVLVRGYVGLGKTAEAEAAARAYLAGQPDDVAVKEMLARLQLNAGQSGEAIRLYREIVAARPETTSAYLALSGIHQSRGEGAEAVAALREGLEANPSSQPVRLALANVYAQQQQFDSALQLLEEAYAANPESLAVRNNLAALLLDTAPSEENLQRVTRLTADFEATGQAPLMDTRGWLQYRLGNYPQALALLEAAQRAGGEGPEYWYHRGMAYLAGDDSERARELLTKALEDDSVHFTGREAAARALQGL